VRKGRCGVNVFNNLGLLEKCDILRKHALYITAISYYHYTIKLYTWDRFFIEEYFDNEQDEITRITIAEQHDMVKYLDCIDLSDIASLPGFRCDDLL
jgi:hypothetical protein